MAVNKIGPSNFRQNRLEASLSVPSDPAQPAPWYRSLYGVVLRAVASGITVGAIWPDTGESLKPLGDAFIKMVKLVIAPVIFCTVITGIAGMESLGNLIGLVATFYLTSIIFVVVVLGLVSRACGFSIFRLVGYIRQELLLVLGTSSSEAALPNFMAKLERAGADRSVVGRVVPNGYAFNLDGPNIYKTMSALFIAKATNTDLSTADQALQLLVAMISSKGSAGVPDRGQCLPRICSDDGPCCRARAQA